MNAAPLPRGETRPRVLVNDQCLDGLLTGVGQYLAAILAHWPSGSDVDLIGRQGNSPVEAQPGGSLPGVEQLRPLTFHPLSALRPKLRPRPRLVEWLRPFAQRIKSLRATRRLRRGAFDAYFEPNGLTNAVGDLVVATMHDLSVIELPGAHPPQRVGDWKRWLDFARRATDHWICPSQATASALARTMSVSLARVSVIPHGPRWPNPPASWTSEACRQRLGLPERFLLVVGTIEPRKNLVTLLDAYDRLAAPVREKTPLVLAGAPGWGTPSFWDTLVDHPLASHVRVTGYVSNENIAGLTRAATMVVYPSLYEGFGLPALDAMALGTPVITSAIEPLREVCADAAVLVDPRDTRGWTSAMAALLDDEPARRHLAAAGHARSQLFSWTISAKAHHDLFARLTG